MAEFLCSSCGHTMPARQEYVGKKAKCPSCQMIGTVRADQIAQPVFPPKIQAARQPGQQLAGSNPFSFLNIRPLLSRLDDSDTVFVALSSIWQILVLLYAVGFLVFWLYSWLALRVIEFAQMPLLALMQVTTLVAAFFATQIMWHRGQELRAKGTPNQRFVVVPVFARFISAVSEAGAASLLICSIPFSIIAAVSGVAATPMFPTQGIDDFAIRSLVAGFSTLISFIAFSVVLLIYGRLIRELLDVIFSIANDITTIAGRGDTT